MEFCPGTLRLLVLIYIADNPSGGGIIDMMNRRLRERLTEAEILQIFVDVCEARSHSVSPTYSPS